MQMTHQKLLLLILTAEVLCCRKTSVPNSVGCSGRTLQTACARLANHNRPVAATAHLHVPQFHTCLGQVRLSAYFMLPLFVELQASPFSLSSGCTWDLCCWENQHLAVCFEATLLCHSLSVSASKQEAVCSGYADAGTLCHVLVKHSLSVWQSFHCYMLFYQACTLDRLQDPVREGAATIPLL